MTTTYDTPRVWIGDLSAYNSGNLRGMWVDATDADEMRAAAERLLVNSQGDEAFVADYDGFPESVVRDLGEYPDFDTVANVANVIEEHGGAFSAWVEVADVDLSDSNLGNEFQEHFRGEWDSEEAWAMDFISWCGWAGVEQIPDSLMSYLDMDSIASELFSGGRYTFNDGFVFEDEV